jgi:hypothetical protein
MRLIPIISVLPRMSLDSSATSRRYRQYAKAMPLPVPAAER